MTGKPIKYTIFLFLFWITSGLTPLLAQQYAQITRDYETIVRETKQKIKLFEGEIYEVLKDENTAQLSSEKRGIILKINNITIDLPWGSGTKQTYLYPKKFNADSFNIIRQNTGAFLTQIQETGKYRFDITSLQTSDMIYFASYGSKGVVRLQENKVTKVDSSYFENNFYGQLVRMIIPNYPTLGFTSDEISILSSTPIETALPENNSESESSNTIVTTSESPLSPYKSLLLIIAGLALLGILWIAFRSQFGTKSDKKNTQKNTPKRQNELRRKRKLGQASSDTTEKDTNTNSGTVSNSDKEKKITQESTIIESEKSNPTPVSSETDLDKESNTEKIPEKKVVEDKIPSSETQLESELGEKMPEEDKIEIEREYQPFNPNNQILSKENAARDLEKIEKLESKVSELEETNQTLEEEKKDLQGQLHELTEKLIETPAQVIQDEFTSESGNSSKDTISVPQGITVGNYAYFCEWFKNYLEKADYIVMKVKEFHERSIKEDAQSEKAIIEGILYRFYTSRNTLVSLDYWKFIVQELENTNGKIIEPKLVIDLENIIESERVNYLQNRLFQEVLASYFGTILVMCEEMRNIDRFTNLKFLLAENISTYFAKESQTLVKAFSGNSSRRVNYVPLFQKYEPSEEMKVEVITEESFMHPAFYEEVKEVTGEVVAIKQYGFGDTPSEIIIG